MVACGRAKGAFAILFLLFFLSSCAFSVSADSTDYSAEFRNFTDAIPDDVKGLLPYGADSEDETERAEAVLDAADPKKIFKIFVELFGFRFRDALHMFASLLGILLVSALCSVICEHTGNKSSKEALSFCVGAAITASVLGKQLGIVQSVKIFLDSLTALVNSMIPLIGVLYALGGNVRSAGAGTSSLVFFLAVCENFCSGTLMPLVGICLSFSAVSAFSPSMKLGALTAKIKKTYSFFLGLLMSVLALIMGTQTSLAAKADSIGARTAKIAASTFIPVVGSAVGDSFRTVASGIEYIRASVGTLAIVVILLMLLPTLMSLFLGSTAVGLASSLADILGCEREGRLLSELGNLYGYMIAVCSISSVMFIYALTLFVRCSSAFAV